MTKKTLGKHLTRKLETILTTVGEQIRTARLRRDLTIATVAERASCSPLTIAKVERGAPTVAMGIYARVLFAIQLEDDLLQLAKDDKMGHLIQDLKIKERKRASKRKDV